MAWTGVGPRDDDDRKIAHELPSNPCSAGAGIAGGHVPHHALSDWGYDEACLRRRMLRCNRSPRWTHYLNPFRLVGYPLAFLIPFPCGTG